MDISRIQSILDDVTQGIKSIDLFLNSTLPNLTTITIGTTLFKVIDNFCIFKVIVNKSYETNTEIEIIDSSNNILGYIYFSNEKKLRNV